MAYKLKLFKCRVKIKPQNDKIYDLSDILLYMRNILLYLAIHVVKYLCFYFRFNRLIMEDLQWLLVTPVTAMLIILLVLHGFPMKDLLPYTHQSKTR